MTVQRKAMRRSSVNEMQIRDRTHPEGNTARLIGLPEFAVRGGEPIRLAERKSRALLAYLVMHPGVASSRERLAELLWPDQMEGAGRASLRQALSSIRKAMGDAAEGTLIVTRESVMLAPGSVSSDVGTLQLSGADDSFTLPATAAEFLEGMSGISIELDLWISREESRLSAMRVARLRAGARLAEAGGRMAEATSLLAGGRIGAPRRGLAPEPDAGPSSERTQRRRVEEI